MSVDVEAAFFMIIKGSVYVRLPLPSNAPGHVL